jgi:hypothetical protein
MDNSLKIATLNVGGINDNAFEFGIGLPDYFGKKLNQACKTALARNVNAVKDAFRDLLNNNDTDEKIVAAKKKFLNNTKHIFEEKEKNQVWKLNEILTKAGQKNENEFKQFTDFKNSKFFSGCFVSKCNIFYGDNENGLNYLKQMFNNPKEIDSLKSKNEAIFAILNAISEPSKNYSSLESLDYKYGGDKLPKIKTGMTENNIKKIEKKINKEKEKSQGSSTKSDDRTALGDYAEGTGTNNEHVKIRKAYYNSGLLILTYLFASTIYDAFEQKIKSDDNIELLKKIIRTTDNATVIQTQKKQSLISSIMDIYDVACFLEPVPENFSPETRESWKTSGLTSEPSDKDKMPVIYANPKKYELVSNDDDINKVNSIITDHSSYISENNIVSINRKNSGEPLCVILAIHAVSFANEEKNKEGGIVNEKMSVKFTNLMDSLNNISPKLSKSLLICIDSNSPWSNTLPGGMELVSPAGMNELSGPLTEKKADAMITSKQYFTTNKARTYMQPQIEKAGMADRTTKDLIILKNSDKNKWLVKGDLNILTHDGSNFVSVNTTEADRTKCPTENFPFDHFVVTATISPSSPSSNNRTQTNITKSLAPKNKYIEIRPNDVGPFPVRQHREGSSAHHYSSANNMFPLRSTGLTSNEMRKRLSNINNRKKRSLKERMGRRLQGLSNIRQRIGDKISRRFRPSTAVAAAGGAKRKRSSKKRVNRARVQSKKRKPSTKSRKHKRKRSSKTKKR